MTKFEIEEKIVSMLKTVFDPEIPVNVYGKEFQFEIALKEGSDNKMKVQVTNSDDQTAEKAVMFSK